MAIWYTISGDGRDTLLAALAANGIDAKPIACDGQLVGCQCTLHGVETTLEFYPATDAECLSVVRHEGVHLLHPIRFHQLQQAVIKSLHDIGAQADA